MAPYDSPPPEAAAGNHMAIGSIIAFTAAAHIREVRPVSLPQIVAVSKNMLWDAELMNS